MRVLSDDSCYNWASLLLRLMPPKKYQKHQVGLILFRLPLNFFIDININLS